MAGPGRHREGDDEVGVQRAAVGEPERPVLDGLGQDARVDVDLRGGERARDLAAGDRAERRGGRASGVATVTRASGWRAAASSASS